jgi:LmbE family N-acetylglucosaminyl deacetylase
MGAGADIDEATPAPGAVNMAVDEALLESVRRGGPPVIRLYTWDPACLSFGRNQTAAFEPDLVLTHYRHDLHQDHACVCDLTWNTFRDHAVLEYEIPKYDGDLGAPNVFVPLSRADLSLKCDIVTECFRSQSERRWFTRDTFQSIARLRGMESNAPEGYAEAFYSRKLSVAV